MYISCKNFDEKMFFADLIVWLPLLVRFGTLHGIVVGSDAAETTRGVLSRLMKSAVARNLNWPGKGGNTAFFRMELNCIYCFWLVNINFFLFLLLCHVLLWNSVQLHLPAEA